MVSYPLDKDSAGHATWITMHNRAALYSDSPSDTDKKRMKSFLLEAMRNVALLCKNCKSHIHNYLKSHPLEPALANKKVLSKYLCEFHNHVNDKNGKEIVNCHLILGDKKECTDCHHEIKNDGNKVQKLDLKESFEHFKEISKKVMFALCDKYRVPYPIIKFHECPSNATTSCTSMWLDTQTNDIVETPIVYLHPNIFGLRTIVHEFLHYVKQLSKDTLGGLDEESVEREAQAILSNEFPYDELNKNDLRGPVAKKQNPNLIAPVIRKDTPTRLQQFPLSYNIYNKYLYNIKRRDYRHHSEEGEQGDWVLDNLQGITQGKDEGIESVETWQNPSREDRHTNALSFLDGMYAPFASIFGMKAADINLYNTPNIIANSTLAIMKTSLSPIGSLLLTAFTSLGIFGALSFSRNSLSYGDKLLMQALGSNFLWSTVDYVRPELKEEVVEEAVALGNIVATQQWPLLPKLLLGDTLASFVGETSQASPLSAARNVQRASISASSGKGISSAGSNTIKRAAIDPRQKISDLRNMQREVIQANASPAAIENARQFKTGAAAGGNIAGRRSVGGTGVNSMPMYDADTNSVMIPSDYDEVGEYESAFGMHVADGRGGGGDSYAATADYAGSDIVTRRNTVRDIFGTDPNYDNFTDTYYVEEDEEYYG